MQRLAQNGIPTSALVAPIIPAINDHEIESVLAAVADMRTHRIAPSSGGQASGSWDWTCNADNVTGGGQSDGELIAAVPV
jgi:DNA repair photolyase